MVAAIFGFGFSASSAVAGTGCVPAPDTQVVKSVSFRRGEPLEAIIKLAAENGICLGIHTEASNTPRTFEGTNAHWLDVMAHFFPEDDISVSGNVVLVSRKGGSPWLDYRIGKFFSIPASLEFNSNSLWLDMKYQVRPMNGGFVGSIPTRIPENKVSIFTIEHATVRDILNQLLAHSSAGGTWVVVDTLPEADPPPTERPFWIEVPYGGDPKGIHLR